MDDALDVLNAGRVARALPPIERSAVTDELGWLGGATVYRLIDAEACSTRDFTSYEELGRPLPAHADPRLRLGWCGVSAFLTPDAAVRRSHTLRKDWLASLEIGSDQPIPYLPGRREHVDLYAAPDVLLACVTDVLRCR